LAKDYFVVMFFCLSTLFALQQQFHGTYAVINTASQSFSQPILNAEQWFLTSDEINAATGGFDRRSLGISDYTHGNSLTPLITGEPFMKALYEDIEMTNNSDDLIYLTGWLTRADVMLLPQTEDSASKSKIGDVWARAISRNVSTLSLVWRNLVPGMLDLVEDFQKIVADTGEQYGLGEDRANVVIDGRSPLPSGSHHQKSCVVKRAGEAVGYVGGIDLAHQRWDTPDHCCAQNPPCAACEAVKRQPDMGDIIGWQDVHTRIRGPAVLDIEGNFVARWNDEESPGFGPATPPKITRRLTASETAQSGVGTHSVQLLRTYVCSYQNVCQHSCFANNAPNGETSHRNALMKAFNMSQNFIYIEDQYFVYEEEILEGLKAAVSRGIQLVVLTQEQGNTPGYTTYQHGMIEPLRKICSSCVHVFVRSDMVYVHSKVVIVDDVYMTVGSNNINYRSMTYDTEISVASVDQITTQSADKVTVAQLAWNTRVSLWAIQTEVGFDQLKDYSLDKAIAEWHNRAKEGKHIVEFFPKEKKAEVSSPPPLIFFSSFLPSHLL
jgi:phospholipase D1/2